MGNTRRSLFFIVGGVIVVLFMLFLVMRSREDSKKTIKTTVIPTESIIPTIDDSVKVSLLRISGNREVKLTISNIPQSTQMIEYELSYKTKSQGLQGIIGTITVNGEKNWEKIRTLGTCSSGACVYHEVVGAIALHLKFTGDYGEKLFVKDFEIEK